MPGTAPGLVAVTGATGFVGGATVRHLARTGWRVRILTRRMPLAALVPDHQLEIVLGDLDDLASLDRLVQGCDAIVHCAGLVRARTPLEFFSVNEAGTVKLLGAAAKGAPLARFVHISSLAAREPQLSPYAASKRAAEDKLAALAGPRDWIALRIAAVYGPGDYELLPLFKAAKLGILPYPAERNARVSVIHIADVAAAIAAVLNSEVWPNRIIELDDERADGYGWPEIAQVLGQCFGRRPVVWRLPRPLMAAVATVISAMNKQPQVLTVDKLSELYHTDWVTRRPALSEISDWRPRYNLAAGFADTLNWYRTNAMV
jgi:nucleoside-diphosphate-sugar epimerase